MKSEYVKTKIIELAAYYGQELTVATLDIYGKYLSDLDRESFDLAIDRHVETNQWMPKVSQIREAIMQNFMQKAGVPSPAEAWGEVSRNLREDSQANVGTLTKYNRIDDHEWSHPLVKKAAEQIGWSDMWWTKDDNTTSNRARYMDAYRDLVKGLRDHYTLTPDLRKAIEPSKQPALIKPELKKEKEEIPALNDVIDSDEYGLHTMPESVREKLEAMKRKVEVKYD
jgi:hypothetical protein